MPYKSYVGEHIVSASDASVDPPALILTQDRTPEIVEVTGAFFAATAKTVSRPWPGKLRAVSISLLNAASGVRLGRRMNFGIIADGRSVCYLPQQQELQGLLRRALSWSGDVPLMYGFAVCFNQVLTATDKLQYSLIFEDE